MASVIFYSKVWNAIIPRIGADLNIKTPPSPGCSVQTIFSERVRGALSRRDFNLILIFLYNI